MLSSKDLLPSFLLFSLPLRVCMPQGACLRKEQLNPTHTRTEIFSSQRQQSRLLYARELVRKLCANHLLLVSSTTEYLGPRVRTISLRDISTLLIAAGFFVLENL
jgi:hypothetical protein